MKKLKKRTGILSACVLTAALACAVLAPQAAAYESVSGDTGADSSATDSAASRYNLASEDWDELLGVTSESGAESQAASASESALGSASESAAAAAAASETESDALEETITNLFGGNASSDGGISRIMIVGIIAFALGAIGVAFFIYSQFIYKAKLRRRQEEEHGERLGSELDYELGEEPMQLDFNEQQTGQEPEPRQTAPEEREDFFDDFERQTKMKESPDAPTTLSQDDKKRLDEVDWDDFFKQN